MLPQNFGREYYLTLLPALKDYIPHQLRRDAEAIKSPSIHHPPLTVKFYMENSNGKLRIYGTAEELEKKLAIYRSFPMRRKVYRVDMHDVEVSVPHANFNLNGELFYSKQDYVFHLQHSVYREILEEDMSPELRFFMNNHMDDLNECYEFVKYDKEIFNKIEKLFPYSYPLEDVQEVLKIAQLGQVFGLTRISDIRKKDYLKVFNELIKQYPTVFLPNHKTKDKKATALVRCFEDVGYPRFMMESELFNAINLKNPDQPPLKSDAPEGYLKAINSEKAMETYGKLLTDVDFTVMGFSRTPDRAVPIVTPSGDHCILACDALVEVIRRLTYAMNIFQKVKRNSWNMVNKYVTILENYFPPEMEYLYFIKLDVIKKLEMETDEYWEKFDEKLAKQIREVGPNGFTVEDVKKEMKYLGLTDVFPEITTGLKIVFFHVFANRKPCDLDTYDMIQVIERSQFLCFLNRFPNLKKVMHYQMLCKRLFPNCETCQNELKTEGEKEENSDYSQTDSSKSSVDIEVMSENRENLKSDIEEVEIPVPADVVSENPETLIEEPEVEDESEEEFEKPKKKRTRRRGRATKLTRIIKRKFREIDDCTKATKEIHELIDEVSEKNQELRFQLNTMREEVKEKDEEILELKTLRDNDQKELERREKLHNEKINEKDEQLNMLQINASKSIKEFAELLAKTDQEVDLMRKNHSQVINEKDKEMKILKLNASKSHDEISKLLSKKNEEINVLKANAAESSKEIQKLSAQILEQEDRENHMKKSHNGRIQTLEIKVDRQRENLRNMQRKNSEKTNKLNTRIAEREAVEIQMKETIQELKENLKKAKEDAESTQEQMELRFTTELIENDRALKELHQFTARQVSEHVRINQQLQETISIMSAEYEEQKNAFENQRALMEDRTDSQGRTIKELIARISAISDPRASEGPSAFRCQLMGLRKIKDNLELRSPLKLGKDITQRLISLSSRPEIQEMATHQYQQFEGKHQMLLQEVIGNIQKLKVSGDVMEFPPLPEYPSFSNQFVNEYWNEVDKQKEDSECLICFNEMTPEEQTIKCDHCRKVLHLECASKWLKIHRSCPHCRREQLDPNEFPALGN